MGKLLCSIALLTLSLAALAGELPFDQAQFEQARTAGRPVVVFFHADWCPTCRVQQPIINRLSAEPQFRPLTIFVADYDSEVALEKSLNVTQQSTLVVFRQGREVTRSTGQTGEAALRATLQQAL
ncbi:thioredoxin family protein [Rhodanobacter umsongensis]|uniref:Thioredoxin family protein n=1 Tax=Rhodanobacter umsongensis TaxID=633153 RepID=A0ABW0JLH9_9GAMM